MLEYIAKKYLQYIMKKDGLYNYRLVISTKDINIIKNKD